MLSCVYSSVARLNTMCDCQYLHTTGEKVARQNKNKTVESVMKHNSVYSTNDVLNESNEIKIKMRAL